MYDSKAIYSLIKKMTLDEKLLLVHGQYEDPYRANQAGFLYGCPRLGIPPIFIADGESGINISWETTALPSKVALAATFDISMAQAYGQVIGQEAKESGMHVVLTPRVNIVRDYVAPVGKSNGGNYQTYGEDPLLNGLMGASEIRGIQQNKNAIANLKQMFGSSTGTAQGAGNCIIDEQTIHEIYLRAFEIAFKEHVGSCMTNYNQVNGIWTYKYRDLTQTLCRDRWGFKGFIVDDWYCLYEPEAIHGGVTLEMPGEDAYNQGSRYSWYGEKLKSSILNATSPVTEEDLDAAVYMLLKTLNDFDMLSDHRIPGPISEKTKKASASTAHQVACKAAVLLKNEGMLPVDPKKETIAIIGPTGNRQAMPIFKEASFGFSDRKKGTLQALQARTDKKILYAVGNDLDGCLIPMQYLASSSGTSGHVSLDIVSAKYDPLAKGSLGKPMDSIVYLGDVPSVDFTGKSALPPLNSNDYQLRKDENLYYMVSATICPPETGFYRICLQSLVPDVSVFEKNRITNKHMNINTSGNLYFRQKDAPFFDRIGIGIRVRMNGGAVPNSDVVTCMDGFNNAGGEVFMEAGKPYEFFATCCSLYNEPVNMRICWVSPSMRRKDEAEALRLAQIADKVLVFVWHHSPNERLLLHENQNDLVQKISAINPNTAVIINSGDPIAMPWIESVNAVLEMWFSGQEGAEATADLLMGICNPSGKLPVSFPKRIEDSAARYQGHPERFADSGRVRNKDWKPDNVAHFTEGIFVGYRHFDHLGIEPLFAFGHGLSYTTFSYEDLSVSSCDNGGLTVKVTVRNTGSRDGEEVVQCYLSAPQIRPMNVQFADKALGAFARVFLKAGEAKTVDLQVLPESLCYWKVVEENGHLDEGEDWMPLYGEWKIKVGTSSRDLPLETVFYFSPKSADV